MKSFEVRGQRRGQRVEGNLLATIRPHRIAGNLRQHFETVHELDDAARLDPSARIGVTRPGILVADESPAGKLAVLVHHGLVIALSGSQQFLIFGLHVIDARLPKALGDIDVVPVDDASIPAGHVLMDLAGDAKHLDFTGTIIKPVGGFDGVPESAYWLYNRTGEIQ